MEWREPHRAHIHALRKRHDRIFRGAIDDAIRSGALAPAEPDVAVRCLHGAINYALIWCRPRRGVRLDDVVEQIVDTLLLMFAPA